ncbi:MAG: ABC transporter substrate-binding protein [Acidimicrobiia bacterium]|nr:ABC transporter substrate-binding protein [Acidimicrobiia bacterium]
MRRIAVFVLAVVLGAVACAESPQPSAPTTREPTTTEAPTTTLAEPTSGETSTTAVPIPTYGGSVVIGDDQEPMSLNPFVPGGDNFITTIIGQAHLAGAYDIDATTLDLIPELLTELPSIGNGGVTINDDGTMTVRYQIRDEAVWSDGEPITGYDFEFTVEAMNQRDFEWVEPFDFVAMEAGDKTFEFTLADPTALYETMFPVVVPRHAVAGTDFMADWNDEMWPAAGPFVFSEWQRGEYVRLVRNANYWKRADDGGQLPYLDEVTFRFIPETESLVYAFTQREVDVIQPPPAPEIIARLRGLESAGAEVQVRAGPVWEHLNFQFGPANRNAESLNRYLAFRQAVAYAISADELARLVGWQPISSIIDPGIGDGPWAQYGQDLAKARDLLAIACEQAGRLCPAKPPVMTFSTTSNADARPKIADRLVDVLGAVGIDVELQLEDSQLFFGETLDNGTWDVGWWAWVASAGASGAVATLDLFDPAAPPPDGANYYRWGTADSVVKDDAVSQFSEVLEVARSTADREQMETLARAAEQILADNVVVIPIGARTVVGAVWADKLLGYEMNSTQASHTWNIENWRRIDL